MRACSRHRIGIRLKAITGIATAEMAAHNTKACHSHSQSCRVNASGALVEVAAIETSCPCASIRLERSDVPAGQFLAGSVTLDLRHKPDFVGDLVIEAKALTKDGRVALVLLIRARVYPASQAGKGTL